MSALDDYMTIFEEAQRRSLAPTSDVSSERDVNVPEPELPGYLSSVVAPPTAALPTMSVSQTRQRVVGTATTRARTMPPMFTFSTPGKVGASVSPSRGTIRTAAAAGGTSSPSPSTPPAADSPLPPPPDALPPPPVALPSGGGIVTNRPTTAPTTSSESSGSGIGTIAVLVAAGAAAWWFFVKGSEDEKKGRGVRGLGEGYDHATHNLKLFMDSTQAVAVQMKGPYNRNAEKWKRLGKYDPKKAPKLWYWYVEKGIKAYKQEHGDDDSGSARLSKEQKMALAREYAREWEAKNGIAAG